ncbi:MAG: hypothetical protein ABSH09_05810 [Bryobacteraceae bacterium]|jgi:hypothetical protein
MKIIVTTSDYYNPLARGFAYLFNRHWSDRQEVILLCYSPPRDALPSNFEVVSLGDGKDFGNDIPEWSPGRRGKHFKELYPTPKWTDSLAPFFDRVRDEHFILLQIDYFIHRAVELEKIELLRRYCERRDVVKIDLSRDRAFFPHTHFASEGGIRIVASDQDAPFRSSLLPAIWRTDYFRRLLRPGRSPWAFEMQGMHDCMNDGALILGVDQPVYGPVPYLNVYYSGKLNWQQLMQMDEGMRSEMVRQGMIAPDWNGWEIPDGESLVYKEQLG